MPGGYGHAWWLSLHLRDQKIICVCVFFFVSLFSHFMSLIFFFFFFLISLSVFIKFPFLILEIFSIDCTVE